MPSRTRTWWLWVDDVPVIMVPDLIINLELDTGEPITTEVLRYGQRIAVIGLPVHDLMKTPQSAGNRRPQGLRLPRTHFQPAAAPAHRGLRQRNHIMKFLRTIHAEDMEDIATGGAILGTGGGGDPYVGKLMAQQAIKQYGPVNLVDIDELPDDALVVPVCMMGAPTVMTEKAAAGRGADQRFPRARAVAWPEDRRGALRRGGWGQFHHAVRRCGHGRPAAGRWRRHGPRLSRAADGDLHHAWRFGDADGAVRRQGQFAGARDGQQCLDRAACPRGDGGNGRLGAARLLLDVRARVAKKAIVRGTLTLCSELGRTLREAKAGHVDPVNAIVDKLEADVIFHGRIKDIERRTVGGFARGTARFEGVEEWKGHSFRLDFQNEFLMAERDGEILVTTPDLITVLDAESGLPVTADALRYGLRLKALAMPSNPQWLTPAGIDLVGPRYFGYDTDYREYFGR